MKRRILPLLLAALTGTNGALAATPLERTEINTAYQALVAGGDVQTAYQLARQRSLANPDDTLWLRRRARTALWSDHPVDAFTAWKRLFQLGQRDKEVLEQLQRLAEHYEDAPILLALMPYTEQNTRLSEARVERLAELYERANRALEGARQLEQHYHRYRLLAAGTEAARLYTRAGDDEAALKLYQTLIARHTPQPAWLIEAAQLHIRHAEQTQAYALLKRHSAQMPDDAGDYWQLLGELAWQLQDDQTAQYAFSRAITGQSDRFTRERLLFLRQQDSLSEATELARRFYLDTGEPLWLVRTLTLQISAGQWQQAQQTLQLARADSLEQLEQDPRFLLMRGQLRLRAGDRRGALADLQRAMRDAEREPGLQLSGLWLAIAANSRQAIIPLAGQLAPYLDNPDVLEALAAAHAQLGHHRRALHLYRQQRQRQPDNPLLLLDMAAQLQASGHQNEAMQLRVLARRKLQARAPTAREARRLARQQLALESLPGDAAAGQIRQWIGRDGEAADSEALNELLLSHALAEGQLQNALAWRSRHFRPPNTPPHWAQLQLALARQDHVALQRLLHDAGDALPPGDASEAAQQLGRWPLAREIAFAQALRQPHLLWPRQRLAALQHEHGDYALLGLSAGGNGTFDYLDQSVSLSKGLSDRWSLGLLHRRRTLELDDRNTLRALPEDPVGTTLSLSRRQPGSELTLQLGQQRGASDYLNAALRLDVMLTRRLQLEAAAEAGQRDEASATLEALGYSNRVRLGLHWQAEHRIHAAASLGLAHYHDHYGSRLGQGSTLEWEAGYMIHGGYPDLRLRLWGSHLLASADGKSDARTLDYLTADVQEREAAAGLLVPDDNDTLGLCLSAGVAILDMPRSGLRPLAEGCVTHGDNGAGHTLLAGLDGRIGIGRFTLLWQTGHYGLPSDASDWQRLTLQYRHDF